MKLQLYALFLLSFAVMRPVQAGEEWEFEDPWEQTLKQHPELMRLTQLLEQDLAPTKAPVDPNKAPVEPVGVNHAPHSCRWEVGRYCNDANSWLQCLGQHASELKGNSAENCMSDVGTSVPFICSNDIDKSCGAMNTGILTCLEYNIEKLEQKCADAVKVTRGGVIASASVGDQIADGSAASWFYIISLQVFVLLAVVLFAVWVTGGESGKDVLRQLLPSFAEQKEKTPLLAGPVKGSTIEITKWVGILERFKSGLSRFDVSTSFEAPARFDISSGPAEADAEKVNGFL